MWVEPYMQIEAIKTVEVRISAIENKIASLVEAESESEFRNMLLEKVSDYYSNAQTIMKNVVENLQQVKKDYEDRITQSIKESKILENTKIFENIVSLIDKLGSEIGVDPALIKAIVKIESNFNPYATSRAGAMGLMQLMPETAKGLGVDEPYDIYQNLAGGIRLVKSLIESFGGNLKLALAAYNAGSGRVRQYGDIPPIEETQNFVKKVLSIYNPGLL